MGWPLGAKETENSACPFPCSQPLLKQHCPLFLLFSLIYSSNTWEEVTRLCGGWRWCLCLGYAVARGRLADEVLRGVFWEGRKGSMTRSHSAVCSVLTYNARPPSSAIWITHIFEGPSQELLFLGSLPDDPPSLVSPLLWSPSKIHCLCWVQFPLLQTSRTETMHSCVFWKVRLSGTRFNAAGGDSAWKSAASSASWGNHLPLKCLPYVSASPCAGWTSFEQRPCHSPRFILLFPMRGPGQSRNLTN